MNSHQIIPLASLPDEQEFWRGERFRIYGIGMQVNDPKDDYYEYMLAHITGVNEYMLLVNVSSQAGKAKAGACHLARVATLKGVNRVVVTAEALKYSLGETQVFWVKDEEG